MYFSPVALVPPYRLLLEQLEWLFDEL